MCVILLIVVFILVRRTKTHKKDNGDNGPDEFDFYVDLTTIMISFLQVLSAVTTTYSGVNWPENFTSSSEAFGFINLDITFLLPLTHCSLTLDYGTKLILHILTPVALVVSIKLAECTAIKHTDCSSSSNGSSGGGGGGGGGGGKETKDSNNNNKVIERRVAQNGLGDRIALTLIFLVYPSLTTRIMSIWRCEEIPDLQYKYLEIDFNVICDATVDREYGNYQTIAIVALILFGIGIPLVLLIEL
jgi:hypothetical protein